MSTVLDRLFRNNHNKRSQRLKKFENKLAKRLQNISIEALEPRLLLSGETLSFVVGASHADLTVKIDDSAAPMVQIIDNATGNVVMSHALSDTSGVSIEGSDQNDSLTVDSSAAGLDIAFDGGAGNDSLHGPGIDSTWNITGDGAGSVGHITFTHIENLIGAANNEDTFVFGQAGSIQGVIDGGDGGFDSLVVDGIYSTIVFTPWGPHSGKVTRDGDVITYDGLEPVNTGTATNVVFDGTAGQEDWIIEDSPTAGEIQVRSTSGAIETTSFAIPTSVTFNLQDGDDTLIIDSLGDSGFIGNITVNAGDGNDTITLNAHTGPGTYTIHGGNNSDTIVATRAGNFTLTNSNLTAGGDSYVIDGFQHATLTATGASPRTLNASAFTGGGVTLTGGSGDDIIRGGSGDDSLVGNGGDDSITGGGGDDSLIGGFGDDHYIFANAWGTDTITEGVGQGTDTIDFTAVTPADLKINPSRTTITATGNSLTQGAELAEQIDVTLDAGLKTKIVDTLSDLSDIIDKAQSGADSISQLVNAIPFLGSLTGGEVPNLADLLQLSQAFQDLKAAIQSAYPGGTPKLSDVITALNGLTKPSIFTGGGNFLTFSTDYRKKAGATNPDAIEALIDINMHGSVSKTLDLETGAEAKGLGITFAADVSVIATLSGKLSLGFEVGTTDAFLVPERTLTLDVAANASIGGSKLNLGILALTVNSGSVSFDSHVDFTLKDLGDTDARITSDEISGSLSDLVAVSDADTSPFSGTISVSVDPGVKIAGVDLSTHTLNATVTIPDGVFGTLSEASLPHFTFDLPDFSTFSLNDFGNVSLNDLLGMLGQVLNAMSGIGQNSLLTTAIPFTGKTLGDVVDVAKGFKTAVLDPLFKTGDILKPDFNGDSVVNFEDLSFNSIQDLAKALTAELGLGSLLDVNFDASSKELTFAINYAQGVGDAKVVEDTQGKSGVNEKQKLTINAAATGDSTKDRFKLAFPKADGTLQFTSFIALNAAASAVQSALEGLTGIGAGNVSVSKTDNVYTITFQGALASTNVPLLVVDAKTLALDIPLNFGASLGDIAGITTKGDVLLAAGFSTGLTFGVSLNQSTKVEVTAPLFVPDNTGKVTIETTTQGTGNLNEVELIHVNNATSGTYKLVYNGSPTANIAFNASAAAVQTALQAVTGGGGTVSVSGGSLSGNDRVYTVTFQGALAHTNVNELGADPTNLKGPAQNGILSTLSANAVFDATLFYNPAAGVFTSQQGDTTHNETQVLNIVNATAGTFTLTFNGHTTTDLTYGTSDATLQGALEALTGIGAGNVSVTKNSNDKYTIVFQSALQHTNVAQLTVDASKLTNSTAALTLTNITVAPDGTNASLDDLRADVETAINQKLIDTGNSPGFFSANLTAGSPFTAASAPESTLATDLAFTLNPAQVTTAVTTQGDGSHSEVQTVAVRHASGGTFTLTVGANTTTDIAFNASAAAVKTALEALASVGVGNVNVTLSGTTYTLTYQGTKTNTSIPDITANDSKLTGKVTGAVKKTAVTDAASLATAIAAAINNALAQAGINEITVAGTLSAGNVRLTATGGDLGIQFRSPFTVDAGGGRIAVDSAQTTISVDTLAPAITVDGRVQIEAAFTNTAYQELGLLTSPTHYDGTTTNTINLTLVVNGTVVPVMLSTAATSGNAGLGDLISDLQGAVNTALGMHGFADGDVIVFQTNDDPLSNHIGFRGKPGTVTSLAVNVPDSPTNGAITDLGFLAGNGETHRSKSDGFFLDNVLLAGNFSLAATDVELDASLGFLGIKATGDGTLGNDKFVDVSASVALKNPVTGGTRLNIPEIVNSLKKGLFLFKDADKGGSDESPTTGVVDATLSGGVGLHLAVAPITPFDGLNSLDASLDFAAASPNWLTSLPSFADPLGFGTDSHDLTSLVTLNTAVPSNGQLTDSVTFVISDGTHEGIAYLPFKSTSGFSSRTDLVTALQTAVDAAKTAASVSGTFTVGVNGDGKITLTGSGGSARGPVAFSGPDLDNVLDKFKNLNFSDILSGLKFVVDFLRGLDGSGPGGAIVGALDFKLPLIDKSVSDLVDVAGKFADELNAITNNPSSSIQKLNQYIDGLLGLPLSTNILSYNATDQILNIDFDVLKSVHLTRPFDLDLADAGLPEAFTELVSLSASGNLDLSASVEFDLKLGLDLSGPTKSFFIRTGASGTGLHADVTAAGKNLNFDAQIGPFGVFVIGGSASLNGHVDVTMHDGGSHRFNLVELTGFTPTFHLPGLSDIDFDLPTSGGKNTASVNLPLFLGTKDSPVPLDFASNLHGGAEHGQHNALSVSVNLPSLIDPTDFPLPGGHTSAFDFTLPEFNFDDLANNLPGIFALLSDPAVVVDGLDRLLGTIQENLDGQIMGVKLPLIGDALANNPASQFVGNMRSDVLQPLAKTIRENNLNLEGLIGFIQETLFEVFGPSHLDILEDSGDGGGITKNDVAFKFFDGAGAQTNILFLAHSVQLEMNLGKHVTFSTDPIDLDLGIPALGIHAQLQPTISIAFDLKLGFGVDDKKGFYFVTSPSQEMSVKVFADLGSHTTGMNPGFDDANRAKLDAQLLFLALKVADGVDLNNDHIISWGTDANADGIPDDITQNEFSHIYLSAGINLDDPNHDGKLTIGEMVSGSLSDIVKASIDGDAALHAQGRVDFSTLGASIANILPSVTADLLIDFGLHAGSDNGWHFDIRPPQVILANITMDLGSFVSSFAGPILEQIHKILEPFDWLIGPDGFLNKRIPLLSDIAGHKITGKDLIVFFDPDDGPTVVAVLDFVEKLEYLSGLVSDAAAGGANVGLNFGDLMLFDNPDIGNFGGGFADHLINLGSGISDIRNVNNLGNSLSNLNDLVSSNAGALQDALNTEGSPSSSTSSFTSGVTEQGSIDFPILKPENILKLIMGQPDVTLVTIQMPKLGFNFLYRQQFPIIGPLVGTFAGGVGGGIDMGFGYDTRGLVEFISTHNPVDLIDGFFLNDLDPKTGADKAEAFLSAQIAVGAAISLGIASAGVEGGIEAKIEFNFADLDSDGKIRINELGALLEANDFNPLAVFDVHGQIDLFMRAYVEFLFFKAEFEFARLTLFSFDVHPTKPPILGSLNGDTLTLNVGPNAGSRLNGNTADSDESIALTMDGGDVVVSSFLVHGDDQSPVQIKGFGRFSGVKNIIIDGGSGDDTIDLSGVSSSIKITMHGGVGNDVLKGGDGNDSIFGDSGNDTITGGDGADVISGGEGNDSISGDGAADQLMGDAGNDIIHGNAGNDSLFGGPGNDSLFGEAGTNTFSTADFGSTETIDASGGSDVLDFSSKPQGLTIFLEQGPSGLEIKVGMTPTSTPPIGTDPLDPSGPNVPANPTLANFDSQLTVINVGGIKKIIGSDFADTFFVKETRPGGVGQEVELDGAKGSDRYVFLTGTAHINALVNDDGNAWDSGDTIEVRGTVAGDEITVTNSQINLAADEKVVYDPPAANANVLQIKVFGKGGDDTLNLDSTDVAVPVRVDGGTGNDLFTVGNGTVNNILGIARTGLNSPFGLGPVVLVGGAGNDSVIVDDLTDLGPNTGNFTVFNESRLGLNSPVEVGMITGLGMTLKGGASVKTVTDGGGGNNEVQEIHVDDAISGTYSVSFAGVSSGAIAINATAAQVQAALEGLSSIGSGNVVVSLAVSGTHRVYTVTFQVAKANQNLEPILPDNTNLLMSGRIEVEGFEAVDVRLGAGNDAFTIGGDAALDDLPQNRQTSLLRAVVTTQTQGDGSHDEVQKVKIQDAAGAGVSGTFTLTFGSQTTAPIALDATATDVQNALAALGSIGRDATDQPNVDVVRATSGKDVEFTITFKHDLSHVNVSQLVGLVANGNTLTGMTIIEGGGGEDTIGVIATNTLDRNTLLATAPGPLVTGATVTPGNGSTNEVQTITVKGAGRDVGFFTIKYRYEETRAIPFGATALEVQEALVALPLIYRNGSGLPNVDVSKSTVAGNDVYTVTFQNSLQHQNIQQLTPLITPLVIVGDTASINASVVTLTQGKASPGTNEVQEVTVRGVPALTTFKLKFLSAGDQNETGELAFGASAATVETALRALPLIGTSGVDVSKTTIDGADIYTVTFKGPLAATDVAELAVSIAQDRNDTLKVQAIREDTFFLGGGGDDVVNLNVNAITGAVITSNGISSKFNLDGQAGSDTYTVNLIGGKTASLISIVDTGSANAGFDTLVINGTELPDRFLARAAASQQGLAFIALLNNDPAKTDDQQPVERLNYDVNLEKVTLNTKGGDDEVYLDDTRAQITINAGQGNDFFQIGQLFQTPRTSGDPLNSTNINEADAYATIETTKGWLSNGVSFPVTINGDEGEDLFIVFHNLAVANLNGGDGDDTFIIQAFALAGSTEDHRALTDISGDAGADFVQYAVNAPVNINGGDGFDTVIVIGTEFGDDFVVTPHGVFGAGLNVNFINVENLQLDGAEGDDRFFVLGTAPELVTEITGGLGTDLFSIGGPTPGNGVISNTLRGHSGILSHTVTSIDTNYEGLKVVGISAHVADNDEPAIVVTPSDGASLVVQGSLPNSGTVQQRYDAGAASHVLDSYTIVLSRPAIAGTEVVISIDPPPGIVFVKDHSGVLFEKRKGSDPDGDNPSGDADGLTLTFTTSDWWIPQTVYFTVDSHIANIPDLGDLNHKVVAKVGGIVAPEIKSVAIGNGDVSLGGGTNGSPVVVTTLTPGSVSQSEVEKVEIAHTSGNFGYFALTFRDAETDPLPFGATANDVRDALVNLPLIGKNAANQPNVAVTKSTSGGHDFYTITFQNDLANQDVQTVKGRELSTLIDSSLDSKFAPGNTEHLPEGLRGATVTIVDSVSHPELVGQSRLILFQNDATHTLVMNKAWNLGALAALPTDVQYEIKLFSGLSIPNVRAQIFTNATPAIVAVQTEGSTSVAEISSSTAAGELTTELTNRQADQIDVRLSKAPTGTVTVALGDGNGQLEFFDKDNLAAGPITSLSFDNTNYFNFRHILVRGKNDAIVEGFHKADLTLTASGGGYNGVNSLIVADIADNDYQGVRIIESNGSTDVMEFTGGDFSLSQATADADGLPYKDNYLVELTMAPTDTVTVHVSADPTRTSRTGGIRSFVEQLEVSTDGISWGLTAAVTFSPNSGDANAWNKPQTVYVRAKNDTRVDGGDTLVFAQTLDQLSSIQGPLFINGSQGDDHTGLTEREPIMLPGEINEKQPSVGDVVSAVEAAGIDPATITINPGDISQAEIDALNDQINASVHITGPLTNPDQLKNVSIQVTHGPGKNKIRVITGGVVNGNGTWTLTLSHEWFSPFPFPGNTDIPNNTGKFVLLQTNPNLLVVESEQTDIMLVHDNDNVNSYNDVAAPAPPPGSVDRNAFAVGQLFFDDQNKFGAKASVSTIVNGGPTIDGPAVNEVQKLTLVATAGTFKLVFGNQTTAAIPFNATAAQIQSALEGLASINTGDVTVTKAPQDPVYTITFQGALGLTDQPKLQVDTALLTGGSLLNDYRITGLGMGGTDTTFSRTIGSGFSARLEPGGITFHSIEDTEIDLGPGADHFTVANTQPGTKTVVNAGAGQDLIDVKSVGGHTFVNLGADADTINIHNNGNTLQDLAGLLTVSGDIAQATVVRLAKGSPVQAGGLVAAANEIQRITVDATGGTFTLSLTDPVTQTTATTGALAFNISAAVLQSALEGLSTIGAGNVSVTKAGNVYRVAFQGAKAGTPINLLVSHDAGLTNGLGANDMMNVLDSGYSQPTVGVLTSSSLTGLSTAQVNEIQTIVVDATQGTFKVSFNGQQTPALQFDVTAAALQAALEALTTGGIKPGDVAVTKNDDVYVIRFQGNLDNADVPQLVVTNVDLKKRIEPSGGDPNAGPNATTTTAGDEQLVNGSVTVATRQQGTDTLKINDSQLVTITATGGTFTLTLLSGTAQEFTTRALAFDASAEVVRQAIQDAAAPKIAPGDTFEPQKFAVMVEKYENVYIIQFQGRLRTFDRGPGVDLLKVNTGSLTGGTATVTSRMDGINYYGVETLNIDFGQNSDTLSVQGTTAGSRGFALGGGVAVTNINLNGGNEQAFVSSNADMDSFSANGFDFLTGNLDDVRGALNLDFGSGRHKLMISDEGATAGDPSIVITDTASHVPLGNPAPLGLAGSAEIWMTGIAPAGISYKSAGDFFDGIVYWTGSGNDTVTIDGTVNRSGSGQRTMTMLNTGLGDDNVTVTLNGVLNDGASDTGSDGFFALNTMGGSFSPKPTALPGGVTDNDTVNASQSSLPLVIFGGLGNDTITSGSNGGDTAINNDIVFGDDGRVQYLNGANAILAVVGFGGRGDVISSQILFPTWIMTRDNTLGGSDKIWGKDGEDILIGGAAGDSIDGGNNDDMIFGDAVKLSRRPTNITNLRFETLNGTQIYATPATNAAGADQTDGTARNYRDPNGTYAPTWALIQIHNLYQTAAIQTANDNSFGNDYIAGGAASDEIFGQLGNDTIQGDGSIDIANTGGQLVAAVRDGSNALVINPSFEAATDGDDYIEGGGGNDTVFGNLGQDDIIGGSSDLFTLNTPDKRPDGLDTIFGGAGTKIGRNDAGQSGNTAHAVDADNIVGDNGDIFRLVGINHTAAAGFLSFNYDLTSTAENRGSLRIIAHADRLLDYTPGGADFNAAGAATDVGHGGADEVHGEGGDDAIYGQAGNDVLYGDGQNDVIVGGYGADWISGGTGDDGMLGDDGRILISRNSSTFGELLYGVAAIPAASINQLLSTPDDDAVLNVNLQLKYTADLTPQNLDPNTAAPNVLFRPVNANDIIYGGLGNDSIHAEAGDDATSGAEAPVESYTNNYNQAGVKQNGAPLRSDFFHPLNPGNVLGYDPATTKFALYDANDTLRKILLTPTGGLSKTGTGLNWLLNFDQTEGPVDTFWIAGQTKYAGVPTDGDDRIFTDLGNDWLVGGTGRDAMWSGWGDDLLNADDDLSSHNTVNDTPDTNPSYEDLAFGGAGRDVLLGNTNGDRLIDWSGEFNTYEVPFAQFGSVSVSRLLSPSQPDYLYKLSASEGADQTLAAQYGSDPTRNGEPFGELGLVTQKDAAWQDQTGGPRDPQAGNVHGGAVDVKNNPGTSGTKPIYETAVAPATKPASTDLLTDAQLAPIAEAARQLWIHALGANDPRLAALADMSIQVGNLPDERLGVTLGHLILIDTNAAGYGWFIDATPYNNSEFDLSHGTLSAGSGSPASGYMDLLTTVMHEIGNILGYEEGGKGLMSPTQAAGQRKVVDTQITGKQLIDWELAPAVTYRKNAVAVPEFAFDRSDAAELRPEEQIGWHIEL